MSGEDRAPPNPPTPFPDREGGAVSSSPPHSGEGPGEGFFPGRGRLIGVDYGTVRVGLAVCDADRIIASPLETYARKDPAADAEFFRALAAAESAVGFIVGLPLMTLTGDEGEKAKEVREFGTLVERETGLPVAYQDERYTSSAAEDALRAAGLTQKKRKDRRDRVAAQLILQSFLDSGEPR